MKYFSLVLALFVCAAVVAAAPSPSSVDEYNPIDTIKQKLEEYYKKFLCARDVIAKNVDKTEFQQDFEEFKEIVQEVFEDVKKCQDLKCKFAVLKELPGYFTEFFQTINKRNQELAKKIREQVTQECFAKSEIAAFEDTFAPSIAEQFQCIADVLGEVSKANGLEELWGRTQPVLQRHIDNLKGCANAGNKFLVILCQIREGIAIYKSYIEYLQLAAQQNPKFVQDFIKGVQSKCTAQSVFSDISVLFDEPEKPQKPNGIVEKLKCMTQAITKAVKDTDFESVFEQVKKDLANVGERVKACKNESSSLEVAKCVLNEVKTASGKIAKFLSNLAVADKEAFDRARDYIKQQCLA